MTEFISERTEERTVIEVDGIPGSSRPMAKAVITEDKVRVNIDNLAIRPHSFQTPDTMDGRDHALVINLRRLAMWASETADFIEERIL